MRRSREDKRRWKRWHSFFICPNVKHLFLCFVQRDSRNNVLSAVPFSLVVYFSRFRQVTLKLMVLQSHPPMDPMKLFPHWFPRAEKSNSKRHWWNSVISRIRSWNLSIKNTRQSRTPRWHCKRWFWFVYSVPWTRIISISNDSGKSHGYHIQTAKVRRTSSRRSICLYPGKNERCSEIIENPKIGMSRNLDSSTTTQMAQNHGPAWKIQSSSWMESVRSSFGTTVVGKAIWENPFEVRLGEDFQLGMLIRTPWKGLFLSVYVDDMKLAGKKQNIDPMLKVLNKEVDLGEPTSFFDHVYLACTHRQCEISRDIFDNYRTMLGSRIFRRSNWKITMLGKSAYFILVIWHGGSCKEMCGTLLWVGKQDDLTTLQSFYTMHWWP